MEDELSQLDELIESDVLDALGEELTDDIQTTDKNTQEIILEDFIEEDSEDEMELEKNWELELDNNKEEIIQKENDAINMVDMNTTDLASLLGQLLNNKTIEITIKIKD